MPRLLLCCFPSLLGNGPAFRRRKRKLHQPFDLTRVVANLLEFGHVLDGNAAGSDRRYQRWTISNTGPDGGPVQIGLGADSHRPHPTTVRFLTWRQQTNLSED